MILHFKDKDEYVNRFHNLIDPDDHQTISFSHGSISFHDQFYSWTEKPVMYIEKDGHVVSVLFYNNTRDKYCSIINILTPVKYRGKGCARELMREAVKYCYNNGARRLRLNCDNIPGTIAFYNKLGLMYLGVTRSNALYCNVPLLTDDIGDFNKYKDMSISEIVGDNQSVKNLIRRRSCADLSTKIYANHADYVDMDRYKYREFLEILNEET